MPRGTTKERAQMIAADFIAGGMKYAPIGRKYSKIGQRGGTDASLPTVLGKQTVLKNTQVQKALEEMIPKQGEETVRYVRKKLYNHAENEKNPHISLKAVEIMARTESMLSDNVNVRGEHKIADFVVDMTELPGKVVTDKPVTDNL